jgi:formylglycine-generating enzyme required for sulfatase activity
MTFMLIPPGEFMMGSSDLELERLFRKWTSVDNRVKDLIRGEGPQHRVRITRPFYLGKYEVTQSQWQAVMNNTPSANKDSLSHPVEKVSWVVIQSFLENLNQQAQPAGTSFALPTEAQWEYACRAGTKTSWHWGDSYAFVDEYAWYGENSEEKTHPVGELKPNAWDLYDMHGNVREWCADLVDTPTTKSLRPMIPAARSTEPTVSCSARHGGIPFWSAARRLVRESMSDTNT